MLFLRAAFMVVLTLLMSAFAFAAEGDYAVGQIWEMQSGDYAGHFVVISHVETHPVAGYAIHISVPGPVSNSDGKTQPVFPHFPFAAEGLDKSDLKLVGQMESVPDVWKEGYGIWNDAVMSGKAGLFAVTVPETMDLIFAVTP